MTPDPTRHHGGFEAAHCAASASPGAHEGTLRSLPDGAAAPDAARAAALAPTAGGRAPGFDFLDRLRR